jgi:NAD(P)-dependent dehydrogenase (short-subunit alcohol dehydrogenase family)
METRSVLVTGASTGIGHATVTALARDGFRTWATVRRQPDAERLSEELGDAVTPLLVDLEDEESVRAAGRRVCAEGPLHGLVNNAGAAMSGPLELLPIATFRRQLEINLVGQLLMTQVMLPALLAAGARHGDARVVMVGSIGGRIAGPTLGAYQAAKHGLVGLTGALRAELAPSHVKVVLVEPGVIATPIWVSGRAAAERILDGQPAEVVRRYEKQLQAALAMAERGQQHGLPPEVPAQIILHALTAKNPRPRQTVGRDAAVVAALVRLLPFRLVYRLTDARA